MGGDQVKDENNAAAIFEELSSSPAGTEASTPVDAYGLLKGNKVQQSDGTQSYTQANLGSGPNATVTWARLPKELKPKEFAKYKDAVVI